MISMCGTCKTTTITTTNNQPPTPSYQQQATINQQQTSNNQQPTANNQQQKQCQFQTMSMLKLQTIVHWKWEVAQALYADVCSCVCVCACAVCLSVFLFVLLAGRGAVCSVCICLRLVALSVVCSNSDVVCVMGRHMNLQHIHVCIHNHIPKKTVWNYKAFSLCGRSRICVTDSLSLSFFVCARICMFMSGCAYL